MDKSSPISKTVFSRRTITLLSCVWLVVGLAWFGGDRLLGAAMSPTIAVASFLILLITIISAAIGVVRQADGLAAQLGEPYGTLILTLSIVTIEVILIAAVLLGPGEHPTIGKDSIFSVMMIIMNLIVGLCILLGGLKFGEQEYNALGTMTYLGMIVTLGGMGMLLPNVIEGAGGGQFSDTQALFLSLLIVILYGLFLFFKQKVTDICISNLLRALWKSGLVNVRQK